MRLTIESNASTGRFAVLDESEPRRLLFETYHLTAPERAAISNALRHIEMKSYDEGFRRATGNVRGFLEGML